MEDENGIVPQPSVDVPMLHGTVGYSGGITIPTAPYRQVKVAAWLTLPCPPNLEGAEQVYQAVKTKVEEWVSIEAAEISDKIKTGV